MVNKSYNEKCTTCCNIHCLNATVVFTVNKWSCFEHWNTYCVLVKWNPLNPLTLSVNVNMHVSASHSKTCALSRASPTVQSKTNIRHNNILRMENKKSKIIFAVCTHLLVCISYRLLYCPHQHYTVMWLNSPNPGHTLLVTV